MSVPQRGDGAWAQRTLVELGAVLCESGAAWVELLATGVSPQRVATLYPFNLPEWLTGAKRLQREPGAQQWLTEHSALIKQLVGALPGFAAQPLYRQVAQARTLLLGGEEAASAQTLELLLVVGLVHALTGQPFVFAPKNFLDGERIANLQAERLTHTARVYAEQVEVLLTVVKNL